MAGTTWALDARVRAPPDVIYAWLTDYREDDHRRPAFLQAAQAKPSERSATRRILARTGDGLSLEDTWKGRTFRSQVRFDRAARTVTIAGEYGYHATWRATPDGDGTRVEVRGRMAPKGLFKLLLPLFAGMMRRETERDFRGHIAELETDLGVAPKAAPGRA